MTSRKEIELYLSEVERRLKHMKVIEQYEYLKLESIKPDRERLYRILLCDEREGGCVPMSGFYSAKEVEAAVMTLTYFVRLMQSHIKNK